MFNLEIAICVLQYQPRMLDLSHLSSFIFYF